MVSVTRTTPTGGKLEADAAVRSRPGWGCRSDGLGGQRSEVEAARSGCAYQCDSNTFIARCIPSFVSRRRARRIRAIYSLLNGFEVVPLKMSGSHRLRLWTDAKGHGMALSR
jgi:hypothetical protein